MPTLSDYDLELIRRPGDGACLYWSGGTLVGSYDRNSFDLQRGTRSRCAHAPRWPKVCTPSHERSVEHGRSTQ